MIKAIIVEDEPNNSERLAFLLNSSNEDVQVVGVAASIKEAADLVKTNNPDLVFLDIELPDGTGFDFLRLYTDIPFHVIFTTSFDKYAVKAFRFSAADYLLKPLEKDELVNAIQKVRKLIQNNLNETNKETIHKRPASSLIEDFTKIALPSLEGFNIIELSNIIRCEAEGSYTKFYLAGKKELLVSRNLKEYEDILAEHNFIRVHHSHLINLNHVVSYVRGEGGYVVMTDQTQVQVSKRKKNDLLEKFPGL